MKKNKASAAKLEDPKFVALVDQLPGMQQEENRLRSQIADLTNRLDQLHRTQQSDGAMTVTVLDGKQR